MAKDGDKERVDPKSFFNHRTGNYIYSTNTISTTKEKNGLKVKVI
jgi:hypothetical protein